MTRTATIMAMGTGSVSSGTFLVNEGFEGGVLPSGWTTMNGSPDYNYTAAPLADSKSLYLSAVSTATRNRVDITGIAEVYAYFLLKLTNGTLPGSGINVGGTSAIGSGGPTEVFLINATGQMSFGNAATSSPISVGTLYHVWLYYLQGSGANAVCNVGWSTSGTRPTGGGTFAQITNGAFTNLVAKLYFGPATTTFLCDMVIDNVRMAVTQIGDNGSF